ncbi:hypothetical protein H9Y05_08515 [Crocinitomicaceae bacterium CZZ-1]|uniref:Uncharacterized protein n=1 Tax=Taishania pollutisoli TaxID=2766479 RepID=A0A8J6PJ04_9FLAO|nr:hypothetical protein [Taishania pollutisoli]MBC9812509.1 hypothetical protein [Taishania pollutisoli]
MKKALPIGVNMLVIILLVFTTGCKKSKKGVLEIREYQYYVFDDGLGGQFVGAQTGNSSFYCVVTGNDIALQDGERVTVLESSTPGFGDVYREYVYHAGESLKSMGYKHKNKGYEMITPYGTYTPFYISEKENSRVPGNKSGFGVISGKWRHESTGFTVWIDTDKSGNGMVIDNGTAMPDGAVGGYSMKEITNAGGTTYRFLNRIYDYNNNGTWTDGDYLQLEVSEDGTSFSLGGQTYNRI